MQKSATEPRMDMGRLGVSSFLDSLTATEVVDFALRIESLGYAALWLPEAIGRDPFATASYVLARSSKICVATGVANVYSRDATTLHALRQTIAEFAPGRFFVGLGVSHRHLVHRVRGHEYGPPVETMRSYLESIEKARYFATEPEQTAPIIVAALQSKMLKLAGSHSSGAHTYIAPPEHTERARKVLGDEPWLGAGQFVLHEPDRAKGLKTARKLMQTYVELPAYANNLKSLGFADSDFEDGGSDRLIDAIVGIGDIPAIQDRIRAHFEAGADHVCLQTLRPDGGPGPHLQTLERLAPKATD